MGSQFLPKLYKRWSELFTSAFGLIAALAWNSAVQELIEETDLKQQQKFYYAAAVTGAAVLVAYMLEIGGEFLSIGWGAAMSSVWAAEGAVQQQFTHDNKEVGGAQLLTFAAAKVSNIGAMRLDFSHVGGLNEFGDLTKIT